MRRIMLAAIALSPFVIFGCGNRAYYDAMKNIGHEKREMLTDRVQDAQNTQIEARQQLQTALYTLRRVESVPPQELQDLRNDLEDEVSNTKDEVDDLKSDIASVESVAASVFDEWEADLDEFNEEELRTRSQQELMETRRDYNQLIQQLRNTQQRLESVIPALEDQVRFVEHAANAGKTPGGTEALDDVREQVSELIDELNTSIDRTERFIEGGAEAAV